MQFDCYNCISLSDAQRETYDTAQPSNARLNDPRTRRATLLTDTETSDTEWDKDRFPEQHVEQVMRRKRREQRAHEKTNHGESDNSMFGTSTTDEGVDGASTSDEGANGSDSTVIYHAENDEEGTLGSRNKPITVGVSIPHTPPLGISDQNNNDTPTRDISRITLDNGRVVNYSDFINKQNTCVYMYGISTNITTSITTTREHDITLNTVTHRSVGTVPSLHTTVYDSACGAESKYPRIDDYHTNTSTIPTMDHGTIQVNSGELQKSPTCVSGIKCMMTTQDNKQHGDAQSNNGSPHSTPIRHDYTKI